MLFNSYTFWIFFTVVFLLYSVLPHKWQNRMLLVASYVFYGAWDWRFLSLILLSTCVDYAVALKMGSSGPVVKRGDHRKLWLALSIITNLGLLGFFKYCGFFVEEMNELLHWLGLSTSLPSLQIILPVGISFYTFQTMSYTIDVYRGQTQPTRSFLDFALYVAFFPQLVAGPIERSTHLLPQILAPRRRKAGDFETGLYLVAIGLFKKVVIADNMAELVNRVFQQPTSQLSGLGLLGVYAFAFQIYGDFSGYSAIARGVAKWLGFDIMVNFDLPYFSQSPREFWHRWHISLSTWLRDYVYIPLGGSRVGTLGTYRNLMLTMALGGLWHGAGWTFILWGVLHGAMLCGDRALALSPRQIPGRGRPWWRAMFRAAITFHLVCLGWLLFRATSITQAWQMLTLMFSDLQRTALDEFALVTIAFYVLPLMAYELWLRRGDDLNRFFTLAWPVRSVVYSYVAVMLLIFQPMESHEFIYFQF